MVRARSVVWGFFKIVDSESVKCVLCSTHLVRPGQGTTSHMLRHLRVKHPTESEQIKKRVPQTTSAQTTSNGHQDTETETEHTGSVEVVLDGDSTSANPENGVDLKILQKAAQGGSAEQEEESDSHSFGRRRSLIWKHFRRLDGFAAQCCLCMKKLKCGESASTSTLRRHLSSRHPKMFSQLVADKQNPTSSHSLKGSNVDAASPSKSAGVKRKGKGTIVAKKRKGAGVAKKRKLSATLVDKDSDGIATNDAELAAEQIMDEEESNDGPVRRRRRSILEHFERLDSLAAARCRICRKKLRYLEGRSNSHLQQHMSKRHPEVFSRLAADKQNPPSSNPSHDSDVNGDTSTGEKRLFKVEQELVESLRRAQKEEALALEHQRELLVKLRAVNAREAAAEREQIESLRKAQLEEARDLSRQKEELEKEKAELLKKWEELQQEKEELVLVSSGQQAS